MPTCHPLLLETQPSSCLLKRQPCALVQGQLPSTCHPRQPTTMPALPPRVPCFLRLPVDPLGIQATQALTAQFRLPVSSQGCGHTAAFSPAVPVEPSKHMGICPCPRQNTWALEQSFCVLEAFNCASTPPDPHIYSMDFKGCSTCWKYAWEQRGGFEMSNPSFYVTGFGIHIPRGCRSAYWIFLNMHVVYMGFRVMKMN